MWHLLMPWLSLQRALVEDFTSAPPDEHVDASTQSRATRQRAGGLGVRRSVRRVRALAEEGLWELEEMVEDLVLKRQRVEVLVRLGKTKSIYICIIYIYIYIYRAGSLGIEGAGCDEQLLATLARDTDIRLPWTFFGLERDQPLL
jgi:hypothetical protein